ncbi:hypothetical protein PILCRDRAFT_542745 [Piloderma croceum F 1598]|uniref:Uncharacterized protein n=1 Tax=Piloderma croceum (strain F 1598) TaxID=765440 RepID=A0A0C3FKI2_PILCF|nr:hypothetical protein PILCRDRAFT_542745 [Piloderma croceum F 1598]
MRRTEIVSDQRDDRLVSCSTISECSAWCNALSMRLVNNEIMCDITNWTNGEMYQSVLAHMYSH